MNEIVVITDQKRKVAVTHNGVFHADDVMAAAILTFCGITAFCRTRNPEIIKNADVVFDVGGEFDHCKKRFDHHQHGFNNEHDCGIKYASAGLVWAGFGLEVIKTLTGEYCSHAADAIFDEIEIGIMVPIDAIDNGVIQPQEEYALSFSAFISSFNPAWDDLKQDFDVAFIEAVKAARGFLKRRIMAAYSRQKAVEIVVNSPIENKTLYLDRFCPWQKTVFDANLDVDFVIFPAEDGSWRLQCCPESLGSFTPKKPLPSNWAGKRDTEFQAETGVNDAVFCHPGRFIAGAKSREGIFALAKAAS